VLTYRVRNIGIAAALALLAAMFTFFYVSNYKKHVQQGQELVDVYVASHDIPAGTAGTEVAGSLTHKRVERTAVVPGAISDPSQIKRLVATQEIFSGEQVSTKRFQPLAQEGIRGQLKGNLRAISVPGDANQLLLGTLQDGDRIDVVASFSYPESAQQHVSRTVLRDIKVLRAPAESKVQSHLGGAANQPYAAILAVSDTQSHKRYWIMKNGDWSFELRPVVKATDSVEGVDTATTILKAGVSGATLGRAGR
jgi:Flp pilus assembly protein CpaB